MTFRRIFLLILDGVGVGAMPDAAAFGDEGSDTLGHVANLHALQVPNLLRLGLGHICSSPRLISPPSPSGSWGRAALASGGKDTTSGHWEMMGVVLETPFPTYPDGFPPEVMDAFREATGLEVLGNRAASGTQIIDDLGPRHLETGLPILYTSADSVLQLAAHEDVIPLDRLYEICLTAREILRPPHQVGRVIARPFTGQPGSFQRTADRLDFAIPPPQDTVLDRLTDQKIPVMAIGKVSSIFCHRGVTESAKTGNNQETGALTKKAVAEYDQGLIFSNFVDFDTDYGHRNDPRGFAEALEDFDGWLNGFLPTLREEDLLLLASDHGNDPTTESTDHAREYTLLLAYSPSLAGGVDLGTRSSLADIGATIAENFGFAAPAGSSFLNELA